MNRILASTLVFLLTPVAATALQLRTYSAARHNRFTGFPAAPAHNPTFLHAAQDLTGVGWDTTYVLRQFTLVSPQYFVGANHFRPPVGAQIRFLSAGGTIVNATVHSLFSIPNSAGQPTDLLLGRLTAPVLPSTGVRFLPTHLLPTEAEYVGQTINVLGHTARGGRGVIGAFSDFGGDPITGGSGINPTRSFQFNYAALTGSQDDAYAEAGDSGSPSLVTAGGRAAVVGTHTAVLAALGTTTTYDTFLPAYVTQVNGIMAADGYHLTAAVPAATTLTITRQITPAQPRAGYPASIQYTIANTGAAAANNLSAAFSAPAVPPLTAAGTGWVHAASTGGAQSRRGGLAAAASTTISYSFTPVAGTLQHSLTCVSDEASPAAMGGQTVVPESFRSWGAGLTNAGADSDDDKDGFSNLVEYACGGDPRQSSDQNHGGTQSLGLIPVRRESGPGGTAQVVRFIRRTDAALRALEYRVESNSGLGASWTGQTAGATVLSQSPLSAGFESVELKLPESNSPRTFLRLRIVLSE